ncbi:MAG: hypothetical protein HY885_01710 [Deltaproteobacteria bacterium]|nr:hypothetical protein [Deltaproteobacteria bacterium]
MKSPNDIWEDIGSLADDDVLTVLTKLFSIYETQLQKDAGNREALNFFHHLDNAISQASQCNSNRKPF